MSSNKDLISGLVIRTQSGFFTVDSDQGRLVCTLRGRLKRGARRGDLAAIGDRVQVTRLDEQRGVIERVEPRQRMLARLAPLPRGEYLQVIIANLNQAVFVFACADPAPRFRMLDRFLVIAEKQGVPAAIVANKVDLVGGEQARELFQRYEAIGYPVIYSSAVQRQGLEQFEALLGKKISALTGPSGAGKSSLLNAIQPGLGLSIRRVSAATGKGQHTTVAAEMFGLPAGGYVADTPGLKALALWDVEPAEVDGYFPEIRSLVSECAFNDCTHTHEPGCAVRAEVERGTIHLERYDSYIRLRAGEE
ncbi:MAG TPA: ribosome small subunit-dependent GTPase A [Anaerolineales bacterium]|nr:ribosome small subunit-dependent GTPase A [Anaerolineales bacterium]